jgi:hypothetical protein
MISRDASNIKNAVNSRKPVTAGPQATACSKGTAETQTTPLVTPGMSTIAERPATGNQQELKGHQQQQDCLPQSGCKQQERHKQQQ